MSLTTINIPSLKRLASGKVRDMFEIDDERLLFVASDRISAYDVILDGGVAERGCLLTLLSAFWFELLSKRLPDLRTHFLSLKLPDAAHNSAANKATPPAQLRNRSMQVRRLKIIPIEAIVRGYVAGSAWKEYSETKTIDGIPVRAANGNHLRQCEKLAKPLFTPSTKAEAGKHDENISYDQAVTLVGETQASRVRDLSLAIYRIAATHAAERGIILADTKFEFAVDEANNIVLADEVLTPDSSRLWAAELYEPGRDQDSLDKQIVRNWLTNEGLAGKQGVTLAPDVAETTWDRYREVFFKLTGKTYDEAKDEAER